MSTYGPLRAVGHEVIPGGNEVSDGQDVEDSLNEGSEALLFNRAGVTGVDGGAGNGVQRPVHVRADAVKPVVAGDSLALNEVEVLEHYKFYIKIFLL